LSSDYFFRSENCVFCSLRDPEFNDRLGRNLDLLLCLWVDAGTRFPLLLYQLPKVRQREFAFLANRFISKARERIQKKRGRSFVRLGRFGQSDLKFRFWSWAGRVL
jgi:hypothetical protein